VVCHLSLSRPTDKVFNISGQCVAILMVGRQQQGSYRVVWQASEQASGLDLCRLQTNDFIQTRKIMLVH